MVLNTMNTIVYHFHGGEKYALQARLSILTLLQQLLADKREDYQIVVYADDVSRVPVHPLVQTVLTSSEQFKEWSGTFDFVHRIKIKVIEDALLRFQTAMIHVDCDTRWYGLPDQDFAFLNGQSHGELPSFIMHVNEGEITKQFHPHCLSYFSKNKSWLQARALKTTGPWSMWNAGVIGLSAQGLAIIKKILSVSDELFLKVHDKHLAEQAAFSMVAQSNTSLKPMTDVLEHYWPYSHGAPLVIQRFFSALPLNISVENEALATLAMDWNVTELRDLAIDRTPKWKRFFLRLKRSLNKRRLSFKVRHHKTK